MGFRFPLATLLRFRRNQERQQEILMLEANFHAAELRRSIEAAERATADITAQGAAELKTGIRAAGLQFDSLRLATLADRRGGLEGELVRAEEVCALRRKALKDASQQREIIDTLRMRQLQSYGDLQKKQEQRSSDDLFLLRREFLRRH